MQWLDEMPFAIVLVVSLWLTFAPFYPEPHLWEKLKMLAKGTLVRPIDIFDLLLHSAGPALLIAKLLRM